MLSIETPERVAFSPRHKRGGHPEGYTEMVLLREVVSLAEVTAPSIAVSTEVPGTVPCPAASRGWPALAWLPPAAQASQKKENHPQTSAGG